MKSKSTLYEEAFAELRNITTIGWAYKAASFLEKCLWAFIGIIGTIWAIYFISDQFISFNENASVLIQGNSDETKLKYPAITICPMVSTKYGIAERLANYIDPDQLPEKLIPLKRWFFNCALSKNNIRKPIEIQEKYDNVHWVDNNHDSGCGKFQTLNSLNRYIVEHTAANIIIYWLFHSSVY